MSHAPLRHDANFRTGRGTHPTLTYAETLEKLLARLKLMVSEWWEAN
jgi:hypothetical protein